MSKRIVTHNGKFHGDEVFAVATLQLVYPDSEIVRTRNEGVIGEADIVVDVGKVYEPSRLRFDHHQTGGAGVRPNGIPYASFGLVWKEYGSQFAGEAAEVIEEKLVMPIDALDNGVSITEPKFEGIKEYGISDYLYSYWIDSKVSEEKSLEIFIEVVNLAKGLILREIAKAKRVVSEGKTVEEIYEKTTDKRLIILDEHLAWGKVLVEKPEPLVVVYPRPESTNWAAQVVRKNLVGFETRVSFPAEWAGKSGAELIQASGVEDAVFCHNARFLAVAESKEGALELAKRALNA